MSRDPTQTPIIVVDGGGDSSTARAPETLLEVPRSRIASTWSSTAREIGHLVFV